MGSAEVFKKRDRVHSQTKGETKMKQKYFSQVLIGMFLLSLLTACNGGGGGGPAPLATGTFTKTVEIAPATTFWSGLFDTAVQNRYMFLLTAADINGSGKVRSVRFKYNATLASAVSCPNTTIKMGATTVATLSATYASNVNQGAGSFTTVLSNTAVTIPAGSAGSYFNIDVATPFDYNGKDNLIVEVTRTAACTANVGAVVTAAGYNAAVFSSVSSTAVTGSAGAFSTHMQLVFAGGENSVRYPTFTNNSFPFSITASGQHIQLLHLVGDVGGSGPITGIALISPSVSTGQAYTINVKLGHTNLAALTNNFANNFNVGSPVTVASALTFTVPAGVPIGTPIWLPLTGTFIYDGTSNLIVDVEVTSASGTTFWGEDNGPAGRRVFGPSASATGTVDTGSYHTAFRFNGGLMNVITDGGVSTYILPVGDTTQHIVQILYDSAALGTSGSITKLGFRLGNDAIAFAHTDVHLVLGHTTLSSLGAASLAANIQSGRTAVFTGTISIPAGLKAGDWVQVPLSTPFTYDPTKNLVVQWDSPGYATTNLGRGHTESTGRYVNYVQGNIGDRTSDVATAPGDFILDMSLTLNK